MPENVFISIIVPAYNEEKHIENTLSEIISYLGGRNFTHEILVVDDGSSDKTPEKLRQFSDKFPALRVIALKTNRGKGYAVKKAMLEAKGKYAMFMDADNSTSIHELDNFLPYLEKDYDVVIASRRLKESQVTASEPVLRILLGQTYILLSKLIFGIKARDLNCGFKAYKSSAAKKLFSLGRMNDWSFDTELLFLIEKFGLKLKEVPVRWAHKPTSKVKPFKAGIESFASLVKIKFNDLKGLYS